ncbi:MAG TPA: carboxylating nicotinate-nucleotide diphosphorylase [Actinomycetota bacterium]|nr:carboxylating nicotinate-nucleotide diphosphorylase [Actinomycetota bacterium]
MVVVVSSTSLTSPHLGASAADDLVRRALAEDAPSGDPTTALVIPAGTSCSAELRAKQAGIVAGMPVARMVFETAVEQDGAGSIGFTARVRDGAEVRPDEVLAVVRGPARTILRAERVAINLLSHLSGVATLTRAFVDAAAPARILCTRKTTPGLRELERAAVVAGGGSLHRASLSDAVLIKDNHVRIAGGVGTAVRRARREGHPVEVEVETLDQLDEALAEGAERILLDNATPDLVRRAVDRVGDAGRLEISGGVRLETVGDLVSAGARVISVGRLTHSAPALDISLEVIRGDEDARG